MVSKIKVKRLKLEKTSKEGLKIGTRSNGTKYSVRDDRSRYFYPDEWLKFMKSLREKNKLIFETLIQTGARIDEALHIRPKDFDFDRKSLTLVVTKAKAKKGETVGRKRSFEVSSNYIKEVKKYISKNGIANDEKLFSMSSQAAYQLLRRKLKEIKIEDWYNFSLHNIRKTHGMWLKTLMEYSRSITESEICLRLGHDFNTFLRHYGSPSVFTAQDKQMMIKILGDIYNLR
ncbi:MAG: tyrosine-type recombinase/integrase [Candidatus Thorarchaeota archaeon]